MRDVAVIGFAQTHSAPRDSRSEVEMLAPVIAQALNHAGIERRDVQFTISGSSDYLQGRPFSFVTALDAVGAWPPISESHVEMDGAWALYEAWVRMQQSDCDVALVYAFGKSSLGSIRDILATQLDPYYVAPLAPDAISLAALQARVLIDRGRYTEIDFGSVAATRRKQPLDMNTPYLVAPLRQHDCPPVSDGAAAIVLAAGDRARALCKHPAWIRGIDHRIEAHSLGVRDLGAASSARLALEHAMQMAKLRTQIEVAELHAPFSHQELILKDALQLHDNVRINPSGGALAANPVMVAGLVRLGCAAQQVLQGDANVALAHATSGPCLQQNLVCLLARGGD